MEDYSVEMKAKTRRILAEIGFQIPETVKEDDDRVSYKEYGYVMSQVPFFCLMNSQFA